MLGVNTFAPNFTSPQLGPVRTHTSYDSNFYDTFRQRICSNLECFQNDEPDYRGRLIFTHLRTNKTASDLWNIFVTVQYSYGVSDL